MKSRFLCRAIPALNKPVGHPSRWRLALVATLGFLGSPQPAQAHLVNTGFGPFYDGILHLLLSPDELLGVVGLSLLAGLCGPRFGRSILWVLPLAWLAGGLVGIRSSHEIFLPAVTGFALVAIGALVALDRQWPLKVPVGAAFAFGCLQGFVNGTVAAQGQLGLAGLLGIAGTVFVLVALVSAGTVSLAERPPWTRIVVRVAGSWVAAIGLLMAGWALR
jgi:hydrogenase/urease accessory protein HupE